MRRLLAILLFLVLAGPALAQEPVTIYFPLVFKGSGTMAACDNHWKIVVPEATTNKVLNPSAETTGNYSASGGAVVTRSTTYGRYGLYSYYVQTFASNDGLNLILSTLSNADHFVTFRVRGKLPDNWRVLVRTQYRTPILLESIDDNWNLYGVFIPAAEASTSTHLYILQRGEGGSGRYMDGFQVEAHDHWTTYTDGDQPGSGWNGAAHVSTSTRSARSRAGGRVRDLADDYSFYVTEHSGTGVGAQRISLNEYALLPGGELNAVKSQARVWTLTGDFIADSEEDLHAKRQALLAVLDPSAYDAQPVLVRYTGSEVEKEIAAIYESGLEISGLPVYYGPYRRDATSSEWQEDYVFSERAAVRFLSPSPYWLEIGESAQNLDPYDTATVRTVSARFKSTGQWDDLGPPNAAGTYAEVHAFAEDGTYVYVGGNFQNFDNIANADYIVRWHKVNRTWSALGTGVDNLVSALALGPDGTLYAGGTFANAGGMAVNYIARWDGAAWSAIGGGMNNAVQALAIGRDGTLYAGGNFNTAGGAAATYIAQWDGVAWSAVGGGMDLTVYALVIGLDGTLYAGGSFTTAGGGGANRVALWDGSAWSALGTGLNNIVRGLAIGPDNVLYAGGSFTTAGGNSANYVAKWNGSDWSALGSGMNTTVHCLAVGADNMLYAGGFFSTAGGITLTDRVAKWNGSSWAHLDLDLPSTPTVYALHTGPSDPVIKSNYDVWIGFDLSGTASFAGTADADNPGTAPAYPSIIVSRTGGEEATIETVRNETLGLVLLFNYDLLDGESLTVDLTPTQKSITSNYFGTRPDAILANSDFGSWQLAPGTNQVTCFVNYTQSLYPAEITAYLQWRDAFLSLD
jgi:hypothetical protein